MKKYIIQFSIFFILINLILWLKADCFNCAPIYNSTIAEWKNYTPDLTQTDPVATKCEELISLLNDTLKNDEERAIVEIFQKAANNGQINDYLSYLSQKNPVPGDDKNVIEWIYCKINEDEPRIPVAFVNIYKKLVGIDQAGKYQHESNVLLEHLRNAVVTDSSISAQAYEQWFQPVKSWHRLYYMFRKPVSEMPMEMQKFLIKRLRQEFTFQSKYRNDVFREMEEVRIKFKLDSAQIYEYQNH